MHKETFNQRFPRQHPLPSRFGPASTTGDVIADIDLSGKTALVTGGHSGLGLETTLALARAGARVVVPARSTQAAREPLADIPNVEIAPLDLSSPASIDAFARHFLAAHPQLHVLVNSAGVMATPLQRDASGNEIQFATNHLGHFRLTKVLWPALRAARGARVVSVSSRGHWIAPVDFDDVGFHRRPYDKWIAYGQSKTANALFAVELDRRGRSDGVRAYSVHPGTVLGPLARHLSNEEIAAFDVLDKDGNRIVAPERDLKTPAQGAATAVWCATATELDGIGGVYCEDCDIAPVADPAESGPDEPRVGVRPWAIEADAAVRLWALSESMSGHPAALD